MKRVLAVFATAWDARQLESTRERWQGRYEVVFIGPSDGDCPWDFDARGFVERTAEEWRGRADGVFSSSDYPGAIVAAALAARLGLPGPDPERVVHCSHKYYARSAMREVAPLATPAFQLVDPDRPEAVVDGVGFPCFVKPVKGAYSLLARRVDELAELREFLGRPAVRDFRSTYMALFNRLVRECSSLELDGDYFLAESLLHGVQTTVEGYCVGGEARILGTVDSRMVPGTQSFHCFDHPTCLSDEVRLCMEELAGRVMLHLGLERTLLNVELMHDPVTGQNSIIEVNPRMCGQFSDLYDKVDGTSGYEIALALSTGETPVLHPRSGRFACAASRPLRVFEPVRVLAAPGPDDLRALEAAFPGTLVWSECRAGDELSDFEAAEDGRSARYAVVNTGAASRAELAQRLDAICAELGYRFERLG